MAIVKKNTYVPGVNNDVTNVCANVDYNRLGTDLTRIEWSGSAFLVKVGSLIECNGSLYAVEGADISLAAADGALYFDSSTVAFSISSGAAAYDATKAGNYSTATKRLLKWSMLTDGTILTAGRELQYTGAKSFSFTPPSGVERITLAICAQGGDGGYVSGIGGGGGGGAYFYGMKTVVPGTSYPVVLSTSTNSTGFGMTMGKGSAGVSTDGGAGGAGGTASGGATAGANGGTSLTAARHTLMAAGGSGPGAGGAGAGGGGSRYGSSGGFGHYGEGLSGDISLRGGNGSYGAGGASSGVAPSAGVGGAPLVNIKL